MLDQGLQVLESTPTCLYAVRLSCCYFFLEPVANPFTPQFEPSVQDVGCAFIKFDMKFAAWSCHALDENPNVIPNGVTVDAATGFPHAHCARKCRTVSFLLPVMKYQR